MNNRAFKLIGEMSVEEAYNKLKSIGEDDEAEKLLEHQDGSLQTGNQIKFGVMDWVYDRPWKYTEHSYGFIDKSLDDLIQILPASKIECDQTLKGSQVTVTLDRVNIADYPGRGTHNVLFEFSSENRLKIGRAHV